MSELIFRPEAGHGGSCLDGTLSMRDSGGVTWATLRTGVLTDIVGSDTSNSDRIQIKSDNLLNKWFWLQRGVVGFNTSNLPARATISSATLSLHGITKGDDLGITPNINIYSATLTDDGDISPTDADLLTNYRAFGDTPFSTVIAYGDWDVFGWNDFVLNAAGIANISKTGITNFGIRNANHDVADVEPGWIAFEESYLTWWAVDYLAGLFAPKLTVIFESNQDSVDQTIAGNKVSLEAIRNLEIVYGGRFYIGKTGNAVYESRYHRNV